MEEIKVGILGMHCASCAINIESALQKEKGIESVSVNYASEKAAIKYDSSVTNLEKIANVISGLGYAIEKKTNNELDIDTSQKTEILRLKKRLLINLLFGIPVVIIAMGMMFGLTLPKVLEDNSALIQLVFSSIVILSSINIWKIGLKGLTRLKPGMDSLIFLGTAAAYFYSLLVCVLSIAGVGKEILGDKLYFESTVFILVFITLGKYLEALTKGKTSEALKKLIGLQPKTATIVGGERGNLGEISIDLVEKGDIILIKPGEKIPVDGVIIEGETAIDESMITGESLPVEKTIESPVVAGTINKNGSFKYRVIKVGKETLLYQIIEMVENAQSSKPPIQLMADKVSLYFVPTILVISVISALIWLFFGKPLPFSLVILVDVLVIACPCALGLATPTAIMTGTGKAAENGILIRDAESLEMAQKINTIVLDKTGTLTKGKPEVVDTIVVSKSLVENEKGLLCFTASAEQRSEHPLAIAIVKKAKELKLGLTEPKSFRSTSGGGIKAVVGRETITVGSVKFIKDLCTLNKTDEGQIEKLENQGKTVILVVIGKQLAGLIAIADKIKDEARAVVADLNKMGVEVWLLTGDNLRTAQTIAEQAGINKNNILAQVLPGEKEEKVLALKEKRRVVAMVGDGINDAPALAAADVGIAMGAGTDIAMESAGITLIKSDLRDLIKVINVSRQTMGIMKQNLFWAFFYNAILIPVAAGVLYPVFGVLLNPAFAGGAMAFSSVSVVLNSLRLKKISIK